MTMMASFLSNINIPAWSLFPLRAKSLFQFESSLWMLGIFSLSAHLFVCIQVMCQTVTSSTDWLIFLEQRSKPLQQEVREAACLLEGGGGVSYISQRYSNPLNFFTLHLINFDFSVLTDWNMISEEKAMHFYSTLFTLMLLNVLKHDSLMTSLN